MDQMDHIDNMDQMDDMMGGDQQNYGDEGGDDYY